MISREQGAGSLKLLVWLAAAFMLLPLPVMQFIGEEGLMALKSYEMFYRHDWLHPSIYGGVWPHSPLWHWPVILLCEAIGWQHVDIAIRLVSVVSTWCGACVAGWGAAWLYGERHPNAGWLGALAYLTTGEVAFWYGWLGYVDAMFGMFIFAAIVLLWRAMQQEHPGWFLLSVLCVSLAFMTKNITAYYFWGVAGLVLMWHLRRWSLLWRWWFVMGGMAALSAPALWQWWVVPAGESTTTTTLADAWRNFAGFSLWDYLKHWATFPFIFVFRALPISLFVAWLWLRGKERFRLNGPVMALALMVLGGFLPIWLSAGGSPRYLVPLYGPVSLLLTGLVLQLGADRLRQAVRLMALVVALKLPYSLAALPWLKDWRPHHDVRQVAREIMATVGDEPLMTENDVATGLAIAAYIDVWRRDKPPIHWNRRGQRGFVLAEAETPALGKLVRTWVVRGSHVYLYYQPGEARR